MQVGGIVLTIKVYLRHEVPSTGWRNRNVGANMHYTNRTYEFEIVPTQLPENLAGTTSWKVNVTFSSAHPEQNPETWIAKHKALLDAQGVTATITYREVS